jgi:hypothetical protein
VSPKEALAFVKRHGVVLQAAKGPVPNLAEHIAGGPIRGSWWGHAKGQEIFRASRAISESPDVLVCRLVNGKVTYVHRRLWSAFVKLEGRFRREQLARVTEEHTATGAHRSGQVPFPDWVPDEVIAEERELSVADAENALHPWLALGPNRSAKSARKRAP